MVDHAPQAADERLGQHRRFLGPGELLDLVMGPVRSAYPGEALGHVGGETTPMPATS